MKPQQIPSTQQNWQTHKVNLAERKETLLKHSAREVRFNKSLFAEFVFLYKSEGGNPQDCMSCKFSSVFENWKKSSIKTEVKMESNNTFKLKNPKELIYVPFNGEVITKDSPDALVIEFLNQDGGKNKDARIKRYFAEIPKEKKARKPRKTNNKVSA